MNRSSSDRNLALSADSVCAECSTSLEAEPVSLAPRLTLVILRATSWVPCARRLEGRIQRQQVGLLGDRGNQLDDVADLLRGPRQFCDPLVGLMGLVDRAFGDPA